MCPLGVTMLFLLHRQTVKTTSMLHCLSPDAISSPISRPQSLSKKRKVCSVQNGARTQPAKQREQSEVLLLFWSYCYTIILQVWPVNWNECDTRGYTFSFDLMGCPHLAPLWPLLIVTTSLAPRFCSGLVSPRGVGREDSRALRQDSPAPRSPVQAAGGAAHQLAHCRRTGISTNSPHAVCY